MLLGKVTGASLSLVVLNGSVGDMNVGTPYEDVWKAASARLLVASKGGKLRSPLTYEDPSCTLNSYNY